MDCFSHPASDVPVMVRRFAGRLKAFLASSHYSPSVWRATTLRERIVIKRYPHREEAEDAFDFFVLCEELEICAPRPIDVYGPLLAFEELEGRTLREWANFRWIDSEGCYVTSLTREQESTVFATMLEVCLKLFEAKQPHNDIHGGNIIICPGDQIGLIDPGWRGCDPFFDLFALRHLAKVYGAATEAAAIESVILDLGGIIPSIEEEE